MAKALTVKFIENVKPAEARREVADAAMPGLYLVVQPSGARSFAFRYRIGGKPKKLTIGPAIGDRSIALPAGTFPELGEGHTLAEARDAAARAATAVQEGVDPAAHREKVKTAAASGADTVDAALNAFISQHVERKNRASTARETKRFIDLYLRPAWGDRKIKRIGKADVVDLLTEVMKRGGPASANRVLSIVSKFFNWAVDEIGILVASPARGIKAPAKLVARDRVLSSDEIRLLWKASGRIEYPFGHLFRMLLLTGQRREEVAGATWSEINGNVWIIGQERAKNGKEHAVPICRQVSELLSSIPAVGSPFVFTTNRETSVSGYSKAKSRLDVVMLDVARQEAVEEGRDPLAVTIQPWTIHDLRRTAASGMASLSVPVHIVEAVLNHRSGSVSGVAAVYNRYDYLDEKRSALAAWANRVDQIVGEGHAGNVVSLTRGSAG